jgi:hypothetical protein
MEERDAEGKRVRRVREASGSEDRAQGKAFSRAHRLGLARAKAILPDLSLFVEYAPRDEVRDLLTWGRDVAEEADRPLLYAPFFELLLRAAVARVGDEKMPAQRGGRGEALRARWRGAMLAGQDPATEPAPFTGSMLAQSEPAGIIAETAREIVEKTRDAKRAKKKPKKHAAPATDSLGKLRDLARHAPRKPSAPKKGNPSRRNENSKQSRPRKTETG